MRPAYLFGSATAASRAACLHIREHASVDPRVGTILVHGPARPHDALPRSRRRNLTALGLEIALTSSAKGCQDPVHASQPDA